MQENLVERLNQFALTIDYIDKATLYDIEGFFYDIMVNGYGASYYELCIETQTEGGENDLNITWCSIPDRRDTNARVLTDDNKYYLSLIHI